MTAATIIEQIRKLPPEDQLLVIQFAYKLDAERKLSGDELSALAKRMTECTDPKEVSVIREAISRGFYGTGKDA
jgi:hypothetical protein